MQKLRHLYIELYGINIYYICCNRAVYKKRIRLEFKQDAPEESSDAAGSFQVYARSNQPIGVIWLAPTAKIEHLIHECLHCVHFFLDHKGLVLSDNSEEAYAYLIQYIFNKTKGALKMR